MAVVRRRVKVHASCLAAVEEAAEHGRAMEEEVLPYWKEDAGQQQQVK